MMQVFYILLSRLFSQTLLLKSKGDFNVEIAILRIRIKFEIAYYFSEIEAANLIRIRKIDN